MYSGPLLIDRIETAHSCPSNKYPLFTQLLGSAVDKHSKGAPDVIDGTSEKSIIDNLRNSRNGPLSNADSPANIIVMG